MDHITKRTVGGPLVVSVGCFLLKLGHFQEQYKFIYDSLEEYCRGIDSRFPVSDLANKIKEKTLKDKKIKKNAYAFEYAVRGENEPLYSSSDNLFDMPYE